ncbi:heme exporter protein CcmD [Marinimicrobium alkaliphilum]|uniref:heme exporter protein CcmD n=1 Tax=Marinimicrobium alkaliphilum TaxID=2202654 RepID=UPI000DBA2D99|nr:heme exporter protein CcmD [Marinimicrobium alkaliphilum]
MTRFQFESWYDVMMMSGHGPFVWASFAITFAIVAYLWIMPGIRERRLLREQRRLLAIEAAQHAAAREGQGG